MLWTKEKSGAYLPYPDVPLERTASGPLSGMCFTVKDMFDVAGYPTSAGSPTMLALSGIKTKSAAAVNMLLEAGARFDGKTVTDELAFSLIGSNAHFGTPVNGAEPDSICWWVFIGRRFRPILRTLRYRACNGFGWFRARSRKRMRSFRHAADLRTDFARRLRPALPAFRYGGLHDENV